MRGRQFLELAREILKGGSERHRRGAAATRLLRLNARMP